MILDRFGVDAGAADEGHHGRKTGFGQGTRMLLAGGIPGAERTWFSNGEDVVLCAGGEKVFGNIFH